MKKEIGLIEAIHVPSEDINSVYLHENDEKWYLSVCRLKYDRDMNESTCMEILKSYEFDINSGRIAREITSGEIEELSISKKSYKQEIYPHQNGKPCERKSYGNEALYTTIKVAGQRILLREDDTQELPLSMYRLRRKGEVDLLAVLTVGENGNIMLWDVSDLKRSEQGRNIIKKLEDTTTEEVKQLQNKDYIELDEYKHYDSKIFNMRNRKGENINGEIKDLKQELKCTEARGNIDINKLNNSAKNREQPELTND